MTENEPLNHNGSIKAQIVPTTNHTENGGIILNGHAKPITNGIHHKKSSNHTSSFDGSSPANTPPSPPPPALHTLTPIVVVEVVEPPDGGARAWLVMISAFLCNGVIFGIINTYSVLHSFLQDKLTEQHDTEASSKAALVGSLTIGTTFLLSPVAGLMSDKIGLRWTTFIGGVLSVSGLFLSSFYTHKIEALYLTYGIMFGFGAALAYTPSLAILGHYFKRYLGKVSGFVTAGSSVFTVILPPALDYLVKRHGLQITLQVMALISCFIIVCSFVYKPLHLPPAPPKKKPGRSEFNLFMRSIVNVDIWKRKRYVIWALCVPMALFGYFVPYVHMVKFVQTAFPGKGENLPVMCIGVTSGLGRLMFGAIADLPGVNRIYLQQLSLVCIGVVTLMLPMTSSYILLIVFTLVMGLFDGCFISLLGPIAYEICGPQGATQAIGFLLGMSSLPLTVGPPIAGKIFDSTGSYTIPLILAGIPPIVGGTLMFLIKCVRDDGIGKDVEKSKPLPKTAWNDEGKTNAPLMNGNSSNGSRLQLSSVAAATPIAINNNGHVTLATPARLIVGLLVNTF
ncbi:monocarboxylate transporter 10 isoform X2 [Episyrphus balteatus]|uniref:monocarboxylate transporter 10 isoform X2 n=1 Tax=Episyrphus balteatus TaxID=286459 RepID=UPI0024855590|nr:monocarboxylate transporter 10 isoform X2 [Episyrphus balteatus]